MKRNGKIATINTTAARIISGGIIAIGIVLLATNATLTTAFNMGIALIILGVTMIILAKRYPLKLTTEKLST